jgi:hypothetical protein
MEGEVVYWSTIRVKTSGHKQKVPLVGMSPQGKRRGKTTQEREYGGEEDRHNHGDNRGQQQRPQKTVRETLEITVDGNGMSGMMVSHGRADQGIWGCESEQMWNIYQVDRRVNFTGDH